MMTHEKGDVCGDVTNKHDRDHYWHQVYNE
jgi:hypothetical protein